MKNPNLHNAQQQQQQQQQQPRQQQQQQQKLPSVFCKHENW